MKSLKYIIPFLLIPFTMQAQNNMDIVKTIVTEKAKFLQDGVYVDKKINIVETRKQLVDTKPNENSLLNQSRKITPVMVKKVIRIDDNRDSNYDKAVIVDYEILKNSITDMSVMNSKEENIPMRSITLNGSRLDVYQLGTEETPIFGYLNDNNEFVLDYF